MVNKIARMKYWSIFSRPNTAPMQISKLAAANSAKRKPLMFITSYSPGRKLLATIYTGMAMLTARKVAVREENSWPRRNTIRKPKPTRSMARMWMLLV